MSGSSAGSEHAGGRTITRGIAGWIFDGVNLPVLLGAIALAVYAMGASPYNLRILSVAGVYAILVIGFQFIFGYAGAVSLAQSCFFGLGAYVTAVLSTQFELPFVATFPASILAAVILAVLIAIPVLKLDDHYFALATLSVSLLVELIATEWQSVTGGTNGLSGIPPIDLLGYQITTRFSVLVFVWILVGIAAFGAFQFGRGLYGKTFYLMQSSQPVAAALGLDVARMRFTAFILSAFYGGVAGAMMAHVIRVVSPEQLSLPLMVICLTMTVIGGRMSVAGAIIAALLITYLREWFRVLENYTLIAYGVVTLAFLIMAPDGLVGALERFRYWIIPRQKEPLPAPAPLSQRRPKPEAKGEPLLKIDNVSKTFGGLRALSGVSFDLHAGEVTGLIGPNGSGKTTLLNIISGLYTADGGRLEFAGHDITRMAPHKIARLGVARTFQHIQLVDEMSALDNIAIGRATLEGTGLWRALCGNDGLQAARRSAAAAAEIVGLGAQVTSRCGDLAYGTRRRVEVARAIAAEPRLLLLDEPAAGLNESEQQDLAMRIRTIAASGVTVLVVEHNLPFLASLVERLVCLDHGIVIAEGLPDAVRSDAKVIEAYLGTSA